MYKLLLLTLPLLFLAPLPAQSKPVLQRELKQMELEAKGDAEGLFEAAQWAKEKGLFTDFKRVLAAVLKIDPSHEHANLALGHRQYEGKWMPAAKAEALAAKAREAKYKAKGLSRVGDVWVEKEHVKDAKRGIYHHGGRLVTKEEKLALLDGKVPHPRTGELIDPADMEKAKTMFPIEGEWVPEADANRYYSNFENPWVVRTRHAYLVGTLPIAELEGFKDWIDRGIDTVRPYFSNLDPLPDYRPVVCVAGTLDQYRELGTQFGGAGSAHGAFFSVQPIEFFEVLGERSASFANVAEEAWKMYYVKHAAAMAYTRGLGDAIEADLPLWFVRGMGSRASHHETPGISKWFGESHIDIGGGVKDLPSWFNSFGISGEMDANSIAFNIYQAGLMVKFAAEGGDKKTTDQMLKVTKAFQKGNAKAVDKMIENLEKVLRTREEPIKEFLQKILQG